jgi:uncharacterized protein (DUF58 family)
VSGRAPGSPFDPAAIPAVVRARLRSLRLRTRLEARGAGIGQHAGRSRGAGLEFAQYRAYGDGDEPRRVDWKLYARSDRYFVRDALRDDPLTVWLLLDASASMEQADRLRPHYRKIDAARELAACVAEIALQLGDAFGLAGLSDAGLQLLPPGAGRRQRDRLWLELHALRCGGAVPPEAALRPLWGRIEAGALVLLISDDFDETLLEYVERLAGAGREVVSIGVSGAEVHLEARGAEDEFLPRFRAARNALARRLAAGGIRHVDYVIDQPLDAPLQHLFRAGAGESQG